MRVGRHLTMLSALFLFWCCSGVYGRTPGPGGLGQPHEPQGARDLLADLGSRNGSLKTFKGVGEITLRRNNRIQIKERVAWVGAEPVSLSLAILISGRPAIKLASNGEYLYYLNSLAEEERFGKIPAANASLRRLTSIPLDSRDLIAFLAGRIPVREHSSVRLVPGTDGSGNTLVLRRRWRTVEKVHMDRDGVHPWKVEVFGITGSLKYRMLMDGARHIEGYRIPKNLVLSDEDENTVLRLRIDRYTPNVPVSPSVFMLTPPT